MLSTSFFRPPSPFSRLFRGARRITGTQRPLSASSMSHIPLPMLLRSPCLSQPRFSPPLRCLATTSFPPSTSSIAPLIPFRTHHPTSPTTSLAHTFFHTADSTWTYLVVDPSTSHCLIIDSTLDFDASSNTVSTTTADGLLAFVEREGLTVERILETHAHADHLTAARYLQQNLATSERAAGPPIGISSGIRTTQENFRTVYDVPQEELEGAFDELYDEGAEVRVGELRGEVMSLPGHTPCSAAFKFGDFVFVGDTIFLVRPVLPCASLM